MNADGRARATTAVLCVVLFPLWIVTCVTANVGGPGAWAVAVLIVVVGTAFGVSGARCGSRAERTTSWTAVSLLLLELAAVVATFVWFAMPRRWA